MSLSSSLNSANPSVTVALPVYNAEPYLKSAIKSILKQTFIDFELLVIDDGSTDNSLTILKEYQAKDSRIRIIARENKGLVRTLNELIDLAKGRYIARMDADDISMPERFVKQVEFLDKHPLCNVVGSWRELINEDEQKIGIVESPTDHFEIDQLHLVGHSTIPHPGAMIRKTSLLEVGGYDERMETAQDLDLWLRMAEKGKLANLAEVLIQVRIHGDSVSEKKRELQGENSRQACERAWARRNVKGEFDSTSVDWRPGNDLYSQHKYTIKYGWMAWNFGHRDTWWTYVRRAFLLKPFASSSWKLLVFGVIRTPRKSPSGKLKD